jgi:hypothetical protein
MRDLPRGALITAPRLPFEKSYGFFIWFPRTAAVHPEGPTVPARRATLSYKKITSSSISRRFEASALTKLFLHST